MMFDYLLKYFESGGTLRNMFDENRTSFLCMFLN